MNDLGRLLIGVGLVLVIAGGLLLLLGRAGFPLGRLPGDISYRGRNVSVYFPLGTSICQPPRSPSFAREPEAQPV